MKTFLALYTGSPNPGGPDLSPEDIGRGMAAWGGWMETHAAAIVETGGPCGTTKRVDAGGVTDIHNQISGYVVVRAESHEAAASMFLGHAHFSIFPGEAVEVMEILPIPTGP